MSSKHNSFWSSMGQFFEEMAPIAGPLFQTLGQTSDVIDRVSSGMPRLSQIQNASVYLGEAEEEA